MIYRFLITLLAAALSISAAQFLQMERIKPRDDWIVKARAPADETHSVVFAVKQNGLDIIENILLAVSDPRSPMYGKHLTNAQVNNITSNAEATDAVHSFLRQHGAHIVHITHNGGYLTASAPVSTFEKMFNTEFFTFNHAVAGDIYRAKEYSLPEELAQHVSAVFNTVQLPPREAGRRFLKRNNLRDTDGSVTPALLNSFYNIANNDGNNLGSQSLFESLGQYFSPSDLSQFQELFNLPNDPVDEVIGGGESDSECTANANNCAEANLDVQYIMAVAQHVPTTYWYEDNQLDPFLAWIKEVADDPTPPLVHSISYGSIEPELYQSLVNQFNTEAMKLGTQGVTITVSSGDDGVANFQARYKPRQCAYNPSFPASSPYVTAVGATQGPEDGTEEIACQSNEDGVITTGGGFSVWFDAPSWQTDAISTYFSTVTPTPASGYDTNGRGYPDISMAGHNYVVVIGGKEYLVSGTSASSPVFAGLVALVNSQRLAAGKSSLGFLNPAIYANGGIFNDITSGHNSCTAGGVCCSEGFYTTPAWDPVTGWGSVDFAAFSSVFANL